MTSYPDMPEDIQTEAARLGDLLGIPDYTEIAASLQRERQAMANTVDNLRNTVRELQWGDDCGHEVAKLARDAARKIIGVNAIFVDDDMRVLAHLADLAVQHGFTLGLNDACRQSIRRKTEKERMPTQPEVVT